MDTPALRAAVKKCERRQEYVSVAVNPSPCRCARMEQAYNRSYRNLPGNRGTAMKNRMSRMTVGLAMLVLSMQASAGVNAAEAATTTLPDDQHLHLEKRTASITDQRSFDAYAKAFGDTDTFPLYKMTPAARARFTASLRFSALGLTTFDYSDLARELGAADLHRVLKPFGFQHLVAVIPDVRVNSEEDQRVLQIQNTARSLRCSVGEHCNEADYPGYKCISHATCEESTAHICTSNC